MHECRGWGNVPANYVLRNKDNKTSDEWKALPQRLLDARVARRQKGIPILAAAQGRRHSDSKRKHTDKLTVNVSDSGKTGTGNTSPQLSPATPVTPVTPVTPGTP